MFSGQARDIGPQSESCNLELCVSPSVIHTTWGLTHGDVHMGTYIWGRTHGDVHMGTYTWGRTHGDVHMGTYTWGRTHGDVHMGTYTTCRTAFIICSVIYRS